MSLNTAPVLDSTKSPSLGSVHNHVGTPLGNTAAPAGAVGTLVSALVDFSSTSGQTDNVTDADGEVQTSLGIAITAADRTNGSWWYSTDNGSTWLTLGAPSATSARLLFADDDSRLYFQPTSSTFSGTATLTFRAYDRSDGAANGSTAAVTAFGGSTPFSEAFDTAAITVLPDIAFRGSASAGGTGTTLAIAKPSGTVAGDVMVAALTVSPSTATVTAPSGWTLVDRIDQGGTESLLVFTKLAGAVETSSYSWAFGSSSASAGGIASFANVNPANFIDADAGGTTASSLLHTSPSVTTTMLESMLVTWHAYNSSGTWTPPTGMTEAVDIMSATTSGAGGVSLSGNYQLIGNAGVTGTKTATASNNADVGAVESLVLRPLNIAPFLDATKSPVLDPVAEDAATPTGTDGTLVSSLVNFSLTSGGLDNVSDPDGGTAAVPGIAITAADSSHGTWYYSLDSISFTTLPPVTAAAPFLMRADDDNRLFFKPNPDFNGTVDRALTFRAWDSSVGSDGAVGSLTTTGGASAFSSFTDTASATVTAVYDPPAVTSSTADGTYGVGSVITLNIAFPENVFVTGEPTLGLETGTTDRTATYSGGSGTSTLTFTYTVQAGDTSADLDILSSSALLLNAGTIRDAVGNDVVLTLAAPGATGSLAANAALVISTADTTAPTATLHPRFITAPQGAKAQVQSTEEGEAYLVNTSVAVTDLASITGAADSTWNTVHVATVNSFVNLPTSGLADGTYRLYATDPAGNLSAGSVGTVTIDTVVPVASMADTAVSGTGSVTVQSSEPGKAYLVSTAVAVSTKASITTAPGNSWNWVEVIAPDTNTTLRTTGLDSGTYKLYVTDLAGNLSSASSGTVTVDSVAPCASSVSSYSAGGTYRAGDVISIAIEFSEAVLVTGVPKLQLETGVIDRLAFYSGGSGTSVLTFSYTVKAGDSSADLDFAGTTALLVSGAAIRDAAGNNAILTLPSPGATGSLAESAALVVDGINDVLTGTPDNDILDGGVGADTMSGAAGNDRYTVDNIGDMVMEADLSAAGGTDTVLSSLPDYTLPPGVERGVIRSDGASLTGNALANRLTGGAGSDTIDGASGNDILIGGLGADLFVFGSGSGRDSIRDFNAASGDRISLPFDVNGSGITDGATALAHVTESNGNCILDLGGANKVTLTGVALANLQVDDFVIA